MNRLAEQRGPSCVVPAMAALGSHFWSPLLGSVSGFKLGPGLILSPLLAYGATMYVETVERHLNYHVLT
jgi:hypothetical protein